MVPREDREDTKEWTQKVSYGDGYWRGNLFSLSDLSVYLVHSQPWKKYVQLAFRELILCLAS